MAKKPEETSEPVSYTISWKAKLRPEDEMVNELNKIRYQIEDLCSFMKFCMNWRNICGHEQLNYKGVKMTVKSELQDLIDKLPDNLKPIASEYADKVVNMGVEELEAFIMSLGDYGWDASYMELASKMTVADLIASIGTNNSAMQVLNAQGEEKEKAQRDIITQLLVALVAMLKSVVG